MALNAKQNQFYTVEQVANNLQIHWQTVLDMIHNGQLSAIKLGKGYRISVEAFEKFLHERKTNIALLALANSEEFDSKPSQGKYKRYRSLLIVPIIEEISPLIPSNNENDNIVSEIVKNEIGWLSPKPDIDGMVADFADDRLEIYFRSTSSGVIFLRSSLSEPEGEVHIRHLLTLNFHAIKVAYNIYQEFNYNGDVLLKFRMEGVKDNVLKTGSFMRDLSMVDKNIKDILEIDEGPVKLLKDNISELAVKLVVNINRGFGNNRLGQNVLNDFLQKIIEGKE